MPLVALFSGICFFRLFHQPYSPNVAGTSFWGSVAAFGGFIVSLLRLLTWAIDLLFNARWTSPFEPAFKNSLISCVISCAYALGFLGFWQVWDCHSTEAGYGKTVMGWICNKAGFTYDMTSTTSFLVSR